jgi:hypothetical protein
MTQSQGDISKLWRQISRKNAQTVIQLNQASSGPDFQAAANGTASQFNLYRLTKN